MSHFLFHNNTSELNELWYESHAILRMVCMELGATDRIEEFTKKYLVKRLKLNLIKIPISQKGKNGVYVLLSKTSSCSYGKAKKEK